LSPAAVTLRGGHAKYLIGAHVQDVEVRLKGLMLASLGGDARAYRELLRELAVHLRAYYRRRLIDGGSDAEDLVQETLIAVNARRASYDPTQPFTPWAYAMARYKLVDHLRRARVRAAEPIDEHEDLFATDEHEQAAAAHDVDVLLAPLPPRQRDAIRLTRIEGMSIEEAAQRTGQSAAAIKVGIHRGLKRLRALWGAGERDADE
jgi:RNA polymerase sigma-70 factor, ECF subfamily